MRPFWSPSFHSTYCMSINNFLTPLGCQCFFLVPLSPTFFNMKTFLDLCPNCGISASEPLPVLEMCAHGLLSGTGAVKSPESLPGMQCIFPPSGSLVV